MRTPSASLSTRPTGLRRLFDKANKVDQKGPPATCRLPFATKRKNAISVSASRRRNGLNWGKSCHETDGRQSDFRLVAAPILKGSGILHAWVMSRCVFLKFFIVFFILLSMKRQRYTIGAIVEIPINNGEYYCYGQLLDFGHCAIFDYRSDIPITDTSPVIEA